MLIESNFFRQCGHPYKFDVARQRFFSQKMSQFKALSAMILESEEYNCLDNHDAFCCEVWRSGGAVDVAESLEKMRNEVKKVYLDERLFLDILTQVERSFAFDFDEAVMEIQKQCALLNA